MALRQLVFAGNSAARLGAAARGSRHTHTQPAWHRSPSAVCRTAAGAVVARGASARAAHSLGSATAAAARRWPAALSSARPATAARAAAAAAPIRALPGAPAQTPLAGAVRTLSAPRLLSTLPNEDAGRSGHVPGPSPFHQGRHCIMDFTFAPLPNENARAIGDALIACMAQQAELAGARVCNVFIEHFDGSVSPPGWAATIALDESHLSAHCYTRGPGGGKDIGLLAIDCFTCGTTSPDAIVQEVAKHVREHFPGHVVQQGYCLNRFPHFNSGAYLTNYFSELDEENQNLLAGLVEAFDFVDKHDKRGLAAADRTMLELGGGPTIPSLLPAVGHVGRITFTDLFADNLLEIKRWMHDDSKAFAWAKFVDHVKKIRGTEADIGQQAKELVKQGGVMTADLYKPRCDVPGAREYDIVASHFAFESAVKPDDYAGFDEVVANASTLVKRDGYIVMSTVLSETGHVEEDRDSNTATIRLTPEHVKQALAQVGIEVVKSIPIACDATLHGYETMLITVGQKTGRDPRAIAMAPAPAATERLYTVPTTPNVSASPRDELRAVANFMRKNYKHFNAGAVMDAADGYKKHIADGGKMMVTLAGAMSTAELGVSLAEMIRQDKVHALSVTGANLEEDMYFLVAANSYKRVNWRTLSLADEQALYDSGYNRVTDTCIPEEEAFRRMEKALLGLYQEMAANNERLAPHEIFYRLIRRRTLEPVYEADPRNSWLVAAAEKNLPIVVPGWEDSTCGNIIVSNMIRGSIGSKQYPIKSGLEQMEGLVHWYRETQKTYDIGFFQIGGGIAGDFPICSVPLMRQDLGEDVKLWKFFAQISEACTSYGGYSGAPPAEKITWGKLAVDAPMHVVESDATIVFPLIAAHVLA